VNVFLVIFNMLPAFPMDGGRVLRALLAMRMEYARATSIAATIGKAMAAVFAVAGVFGNPMLLIIAVFVWLGASQEAAAVKMKSSFRGARVGDAMLTHFVSLPPGASLGDVSRLMLAGSQEDFPVVESDRVAGMLPREVFFAAIRTHSPDTLIGEVMIRDVRTLEAGEMLDEALAALSAETGMAIPVVRKGRIVGLLTAGNIQELYLLRSSEAARNGYEPCTLRFPLTSSLHSIHSTTR
jgi:CBS domain-containing protein